MVWPMLPAFLEAHPDIVVEMTSRHARRHRRRPLRCRHPLHRNDRQGHDRRPHRARHRLGRGGIAACLARHKPPRLPQDLSRHRCIGYRSSKSGGLYPWEFEKAARSLQVRADGPNPQRQPLHPCRFAGGIEAGLHVRGRRCRSLGAGRLVRVLKDWSWTASGYHLY